MNAEKIWLGTALWSWAIERMDVFKLIDRFANAGGVWIDTAANYPINGIPSDFGAAGRLLSEWLVANPRSPLRVMYKVGALDNTGSPASALDRSSIALAAELAMQRFGDALGGLSVHWDNRESIDGISATVEALRQIEPGLLRLGLSGIRRPDLYAAADPDFAGRWWVQVKDNFATRAAYDRYIAYLPRASYMAYGVNMGGVKCTASAVAGSSLMLRRLTEPKVAELLRAAMKSAGVLGARFPRGLTDLAMLRVASDSRLTGCIIGPRNLAQLEASLECWAWATSASQDDLAPWQKLIAAAEQAGCLP